MAGTHITLMASIKGAPFPKVIWKKNEADVPTRADIETNQGAEYVVRIRAENKMGIGAPLESKPTVAEHSFMPPSPPGKPQSYDLSEDSVTIGWTIPILGYTVEMRKGDAEEWKKVNLDDFIKLCAYQVKGLEEGVTYKFRVYASNMVGDGEAKEIPDSIVAQDILIPPEIEMEAACRERVTVRAGHNINIIGYIKARPDAEVIWSKEETVLENSKRVTITQNFPLVHLKIKEATRADHGKYTLKASNEGGEASCTIVVNVLDRPSHCQNLHTTYVTKDSCMINWDVPVDNGGSEITHYIVECREPSISMWSMISSSCTNRKIKAKLMEGHEYLFRVCAANKIGPGPSVETKTPILAVDRIEKPGEVQTVNEGGESAWVKLADIAGESVRMEAALRGKPQPEVKWTKDKAVGDNPRLISDSTKTSITLSWSKPVYDGGAPIIGYSLDLRLKSEADPEKPTEGWKRIDTHGPLVLTEFTIGQLDEKQEYEFKVSAQNQVGWGRHAYLREAVAPKEILGET
uniref:Fibronectin type-III domain-containing protein n=1 Tax=Oryzias melastigma TaxID=30732 RepID=A0A3B3BYU9_ORYME